MCARYTLRKSRLADVAAAVGAEFAAEDEELYKPRYNVAPRDLAWVLVSIADGFDAWAGNDGEPVWFHGREHCLVLVGGLLQPARVPGAPPRFSVFTTRPNAVVAKIHDRMPVIVHPSQLDDWLSGDPNTALTMFSPPPAEALVATAVSRYVDNVKHDDPTCVTPRFEDP